METRGNPFDSTLHANMRKTVGFKQAPDNDWFDAAFFGGREEEKSRAKELVFTSPTEQHMWELKTQRSKLWSLYKARKGKGESIRVCPLSNWTELHICH